MEFSHVFYKELAIDDDNFFSSNLRESNKIEEIKIKKWKIYSINRLSIDQDLNSNVSLPTIEGRNALSDVLKVYEEEKK